MSTVIKYNDELFTSGSNISFKEGENILKNNVLYYTINVYSSSVLTYILKYTTVSERDSAIETIQRCVNGYLDLDDISNSKEKSSGGGSSSGVFVGYVNNNEAMPTKRLNGTDLQDQDYCKPKSDATFPLTTTDNYTFPNKFSKAIYILSKNEWVIDSTLQTTSETPLNNSTTESISGQSNYQSQVNIENKNAINNKQNKLTSDNAGDNITITTDNSGNIKINANINNILNMDVSGISGVKVGQTLGVIEPETGKFVLTLVDNTIKYEKTAID